MRSEQQELFLHALNSIVTKILYPTRNITATNTGSVLKDSAGAIGRINIINTSAAAIYVKFYDKATAATAADIPFLTLLVAASASFTMSFIVPDFYLTGLSVRAVTGVADNDNTAPATSPIIEIRTTN